MIDHRSNRILPAVLTALLALALASTASAAGSGKRLALDLDSRSHGSGKKFVAQSFARRVAVHLVPVLEGLGYEVTRVYSAKKAIGSGDYAFAVRVDMDAKPMWLVHEARQFDKTVVHDSDIGISAWADWQIYGFKKGKQFSGGKITPFDAWRFPTPDEAVATLDQESYAVKPGQDPMSVIPTQGLRRWTPIDYVTINGRIEPVAQSYEESIRRNTGDLGAQYRAGKAVEQVVKGDWLISRRLPVAGNSWSASVALRWRTGFDFWAPRHTVVPLTLRMAVAVDIWPGDGVLVSDPWLLDTLGMYGLTAAAGRVLTRTVNAATETVKLEVLVGAETDYRLYAPSAEVYRYDEQDIGPDFRLLCFDDALGDRGGASLDVSGFAEPSWSSEGGDADVEIFLFDGETWRGGVFGTVASVAGLVGASTITLTGALTGATWLPDMTAIVVLREFASQGAAWVKALYAPICDEDGEHSGGLPGVRWRGL